MTTLTKLEGSVWEFNSRISERVTMLRARLNRAIERHSRKCFAEFGANARRIHLEWVVWLQIRFCIHVQYMFCFASVGVYV